MIYLAVHENVTMYSRNIVLGSVMTTSLNVNYIICDDHSHHHTQPIWSFHLKNRFSVKKIECCLFSMKKNKLFTIWPMLICTKCQKKIKWLREARKKRYNIRCQWNLFIPSNQQGKVHNITGDHKFKKCAYFLNSSYLAILH